VPEVFTADFELAKCCRGKRGMAMPEALRVPVPRVAAPFLNVTVPVGVPLLETDAGLALEVRVVMVA
jgi:hypothetical protein